MWCQVLESGETGILDDLAWESQLVGQPRHGCQVARVCCRAKALPLLPVPAPNPRTQAAPTHLPGQ